MTDFNTAFTNQAASDLAALGGETVTYTPAGGSGISITAVVDREAAELDEQGAGTDLLRTATVHVCLADVASPAAGDKVSFDAVTPGGGTPVDWAVARVVSLVGGLAELVVERATLDQRHGAGYRKGRT